MTLSDEALLSEALNRAVPGHANPQRVEQIRQRVRDARRRRHLAISATAGVAIAAAALFMPDVLGARQGSSAASGAASWDPAAAITPALMQQVTDSQEPGWQLVPSAAGDTGTKMIGLYQPDQLSASLLSAEKALCSPDPNASACAEPLQQLGPGAALILYGPLSTGLSPDDIRSIAPIDQWCGEIGGTLELVAARAGDSSAAHGGYACLDNAAATVTEQAKQALIVGYLPDPPPTSTRGN